MDVVVEKRRSFWEIAREVLEGKTDIRELDEKVRNKLAWLKRRAEEVWERVQGGEKPPKEWRGAKKIINYLLFRSRDPLAPPGYTTSDLIKASLMLGMRPSEVEMEIQRIRAMIEGLQREGLEEKEIREIVRQIREGRLSIKHLGRLLSVEGFLPREVREKVTQIGRVLDLMEERGILEALSMSREEFIEALGNPKDPRVRAAILAHLVEVGGDKSLKAAAGDLPSPLLEIIEEELNRDYGGLREKVLRLRERGEPVSTKELMRRGYPHGDAQLIDYSLRVLERLPLPVSTDLPTLARLSLITREPLKEIIRLREETVETNRRIREERDTRLEELKRWAGELPEGDPLKTFLQAYFHGDPLPWKTLLQALEEEGIYPPPPRPDEAVYELLERKGFGPFLLPITTYQRNQYRRRVREFLEKQNKESAVEE